MCDYTNDLLTKNDTSVFELLKILSCKYTKNIKKPSSNIERKLISIAFEILLQKRYKCYNLLEGELYASLISCAFNKYVKGQIKDEKKFKRFTYLIEIIKDNFINVSFVIDMLKVILCLHLNQINSECIHFDVLQEENDDKKDEDLSLKRIFSVIDNPFKRKNIFNKPRNLRPILLQTTPRKIIFSGGDTSNDTVCTHSKDSNFGAVESGESFFTNYSLANFSTSSEGEIVPRWQGNYKTNYTLFKSWETYGLDNDIKKELIINNFDIHMKMLSFDSILPELNKIYVSREDLRSDISYALVGSASLSFELNDSELIVITEGLYTDGLDFGSLSRLLCPLINCARFYIKLCKFHREAKLWNCSISNFPSLNHFLNLYCKIAFNIPKVLNINSWLNYLSPIMHQMELLNSCFIPHPNSKTLLENLYYFSFENFSEDSISLILQAFLNDSCQSYFNLLDEWLFKGVVHEDLFIIQNIDICDIDSRDTWLDAFSVANEKAPDFLPFSDIFNCGKNMALLKIYSKDDIFVRYLLSEKSRPKLKVCKTMEELKNLAEDCENFTNFIEKLVALNNFNEAENHSCENKFEYMLPVKDKEEFSMKQDSEKFKETNEMILLPTTNVEGNNELNFQATDYTRYKTDIPSGVSQFETCADQPNVNNNDEEKAINTILLPVISEEVDDYDVEAIKLLSADCCRYKKNTLSYSTHSNQPYVSEKVEASSLKHLQSITSKDKLILSLKIPLKMQEKLLNKALMRVVYNESNFILSAISLNNTFLLMDSLFASSVVDRLCTVVEQVIPTKLTCQSLARLIDFASLCKDKNFICKVNFIPQTFDLNDPMLLSFINLTYNVTWPLNLIITPVMLIKHDSTFIFLLSVERTFWKMKDLFLKLRSNNIDIRGEQYTQMQLHRFVMCQYLSSIRSYIRTMVIGHNSDKFMNDIIEIKDVETLYRKYVSFIKRVRTLCFQNKSSNTILNDLFKIQRTILLYCNIAINCEWYISENNIFVHTKYVKLKHYFSSFLTLSRYVTQYLQKLINRNRHLHELDFLMQILTFNSFYAKESTGEF